MARTRTAADGEFTRQFITAPRKEERNMRGIERKVTAWLILWAAQEIIIAAL